MTSVLVFVRAFISSRREAWEFAGTRANTNTPTHLAPRTPLAAPDGLSQRATMQHQPC